MTKPATTRRRRRGDPLVDLAHAAADAVREHGWDTITRAVSAELKTPAARPPAELRGVYAVVTRLTQSACTPIVVPLLTALATSVKHPEVDKRGWATGMLDRSLEVPIASHPTGPMTRARQRRLLAVLGSTQVVGLATALSKAPAAKQALAAGMMAPGGGFLYTRDPARFAASMVAFAFSLLLWFGAGSMIAPPLVWAAAAALAARRAGRGGRTWRGAGFAIAAALAVTAAEQYRLRRKTFAAQLEQATAANRLLAQASPPLRGDARPAVHAGDELGDEELALTRRFVDMALQDPADWSNWTVIDQFQPAALRYQVDAMINALALQRYARNPAATTYLDEAQRRLIERYQQKKVWGYWALENLWGNLEWDPDPGKKQNIMMTGYFALSIGLYQTVSGDFSHSEPGAITFAWNRRRKFRYSLGELCSALTADYVRSPWGLVVCEPNWIFSLCNLRGGTALRVHDRLHGTNFWEQVKDGYVRGFEQEIVRPDGMVNAYRSSRAGIGQLGVVSATDLRPLLPHVADRGYTLLQAACKQPDGAVRTPFLGDDKLLDPGNYSFHPLTAYAAVMEEGREAGDMDLYRGAYAELRDRVAPRIDERGWLTVDGASTLAYTLLGRALFGRTGGWLDLVERGMPEHWLNGPVVDEVPYPDVLVARAVSDGDGLDAVLRATNGGGRFEIGLARLRPRRKYAVEGATDKTVVADDEGRARVTVDVHGRQEVRVIPHA
ncbi:hypothetical protein GCM10017786_08150 [Amycolatopsis deserti]|uniref:Linalool dehydratase/isomerase domain-containing protein n=1 Tax=Amycolatopsis deserti TaxID=185696 RepID=A0ABQ3IGC7_9PSEU|nr:hypothetical protein [Amycolatopsis deserti]GHE80411.1 hypothetical protein GCM10017786_08150 [Amycolatopsis deserti]